MARQRKTSNKDTTANLGFEAKLWAAADALRNNMDAAEYKHVVLGLHVLTLGRYVGAEDHGRASCSHVRCKGVNIEWRGAIDASP